jgi:hypothetical protein
MGAKIVEYLSDCLPYAAPSFGTYLQPLRQAAR